MGHVAGCDFLVYSLKKPMRIINVKLVVNVKQCRSLKGGQINTNMCKISKCLSCSVQTCAWPPSSL